MDWTPARIKSFIVSTLRAGSRRWPPKFEILQDAFVGKQINPKSNRLAKHYKCANCSNIYPSSQVEVDHITPIVNPNVGFTTWDDFINNLFCSKEKLQVLCVTCHKEKTKKEQNAPKEITRDRKRSS